MRHGVHNLISDFPVHAAQVTAQLSRNGVTDAVAVTLHCTAVVIILSRLLLKPLSSYVPISTYGVRVSVLATPVPSHSSLRCVPRGTVGANSVFPCSKPHPFGARCPPGAHATAATEGENWLASSTAPPASTRCRNGGAFPPRRVKAPHCLNRPAGAPNATVASGRGWPIRRRRFASTVATIRS